MDSFMGRFHHSDRFYGALLGLAVGDAVGTTLEFRSPGSFEPITDMVGGGPFRLEPGQWTDDTSMALCMAESIVEKGEFHPRGIMNKFVQWEEDGLWSVKGYCFDIGGTTSNGIYGFKRTGNPYSGSPSRSLSGNGSLMRLAPIAMRYWAHSMREVGEFAANSSRLTHGAPQCLDACDMFARLLVLAIRGKNKDEILTPLDRVGKEVVYINEGSYKHKVPPEIRGSGYVLDCLEAALWCFYTTDDYKNCILRAANLGLDADTTAAVAGQLAGAYYGRNGIPKHWLEQLYWRDEIKLLVSQMYDICGNDVVHPE